MVARRSRESTVVASIERGDGLPGHADQIAELTRQNEALRDRLALFENALAHMQHGLCMFDPEGRIALCNARYADVIQLPVEQVKPGLSLREVVTLGRDVGNYPPDIC